MQAKGKEEAVSRRLTVMVAMVVSIALMAVAVSCSSGSSKPSAPRATNLHGKILFIREGGEYSKVTVFTAAANGPHVRRLSDFGEAPRFSPDGTKVMMAGPTPEGQRITRGSSTRTGPIFRRSPTRPDPEPRRGCLVAGRKADGARRLGRLE